MKIGISGEWIGSKAGGLETYSSNLIRSITKLDYRNRYLIYTADKNALGSLNNGYANTSVKYLGSTSRWLIIPLLLPYRILRDKIDIFHATSIAPPWCNANLVLTVHDLGFIRQAKFYPQWVRRRLDMLISGGIKRAKKIIAVSEYTKQDIMRHYGVKDGAITVIHEGVNEQYKFMDNARLASLTLKRHNIPDHYLLYVGRFHAGKNLIRLLQAYAAVKKTGDIGHKLVLVGRELFDAGPIYREISNLGLEHDVLFPGYVAEEDLPYIYTCAAAFVYPSLFEGFGLPPLEAMACGTPVVSSSAASLTEVVGNAGLLFDPYNLEELTENLYAVLTNESLRDDLKRRGFEHVRQFSWEHAAMSTLTVYKEALS
jgi:glycosyltransferase involved in cell wall biosynthesis